MHGDFTHVKTLVDKHESVYTVLKWGGGVVIAAVPSWFGIKH